MAPPGSANGHALDSTLSSLELVSVETVSVSQEKEIFGPETKGRKGPSETVSALRRPWLCAKSRQLARQIARMGVGYLPTDGNIPSVPVCRFEST